MKLLTAGKGMGKTMMIIRQADERNGYIVCMDVRESRRVFALAEEMKCNINMPITFDEFKRGQFSGKGCDRLFIDNADQLLQSMANGATIEAITMFKAME